MNNYNEDLKNLAQDLISLAKNREISIVTCESCTGGLISSLITSISGASEIFNYGLVTYSNTSKMNLLNIHEDIIKNNGAVSKAVVELMAKNSILNDSTSNLSIAVTGIAGPNSDNSKKEVGLVYISSFFKKNNNLISKKFNFKGDRDQIRNYSALEAIKILINQLRNHEIR